MDCTACSIVRRACGGSRLALLLLAACGWWMATPAASRAQVRGDKPAAEKPMPSGLSTAEAQADARRSIPYQDLSPEAQAKVSAVLANVSLFRRMPTQVIRCDPDLYTFLTSRPDVTVDMWDALGIANIRLDRTSSTTFRADDRVGTRSDLEILYHSHDTLLVYAVGGYQGGMFGAPVKGGALFLLKTGFIRETDGYHYVTSRMDAFFRIDHAGAELVGKTFQPLVCKSADHNFVESMNFLGQLSRIAEVRPDSLHRLSTKLERTGAEERATFNKIVANIRARYEERVVQASSEEAEPLELRESIIPPPKLRR